MIDEWNSCYNLNWKGIITAESFAHPAKFSHALIRRIYQHLLADGLVKRGDTILDPFGGVGLGGLYAAQNGLQWIGCELEPRFCTLGQQNIELWQRKFAPGFPQWVTPILIQGDSRRLSEVIGQTTAVISSPPYADSLHANESKEQELERMRQRGLDSAIAKASRDGKFAGESNKGYGATDGQLASLKEGDINAIISSPPFAGNSGGRGEASRNGIDAALFDRHSGGMKRGTGETEGNLDHLPMGDVKAIISSPPYADGGLAHNNADYTPDKLEQAKHNTTDQRATWGNNKGSSGQDGYGDAPGQLANLPPGSIDAIISSPPFADSVGSDNPDKRGGLYRDPKRRDDVNLTGTYGDTEGQLGGMKDNGIRAVISSPPFENQNSCNDPNYQTGRTNGGGPLHGDYGQSPNQLGNSTGQTFWQAAAEIVQQCALILPQNGMAVWVTKAYVKKGQIVDFPGQWQQLCEAFGFETIHIHYAMLVKNRGLNQITIDGDNVSKEIQRKSFFRLLAEKNGSPKIDFETIICMCRK